MKNTFHEKVASIKFWALSWQISIFIKTNYKTNEIHRTLAVFLFTGISPSNGEALQATEEFFSFDIRDILSVGWCAVYRNTCVGNKYFLYFVYLFYCKSVNIIICIPKISPLSLGVNLFLSVYKTIYISWVCTRGSCRNVYRTEMR